MGEAEAEQDGKVFSGAGGGLVARARQLVSCLAIRRLGVQTQTVARTMNVTLPAMAAAAKKGEDAMTSLDWKMEDLLRGLTKSGK